MQVTITTRHVELTAGFKAHAEERIGKIAHFSDKLGDVAVVVSSERHLFQAELKTRADGQDMVSSAEAEDLRVALDAAAAKLERQVKDHRGRMQARALKPSAGDVVNPWSRRRNRRARDGMKLRIEQLLEAKGLDLGLELLTPVGPDNPPITVSDINRPGLALAGFLENFLHERVQIFGQSELSYLGTLSQEKRDESCDKLLAMPIPAIIITKGLPIPARMRQLARAQGVPILRTAISTTPFIHQLSSFLDDIFAPTTTLHGSLVDVYGVGMLFIGRSGIGKSETALDLVERGHRLVADDAVKVTRRYGNILLGSGNAVLRHNMEIRGLGIVDVEAIFGIRAVRESKRIEVQVNLEEWDPHKAYERLGLEDHTTTLLGVAIPMVTIPIFPGKNITVISEVVALNYLVKVAGYHPARQLEKRQRMLMNNPERMRAHVYEDPE